eukprot:CAMPEP_0119379444 /NCGR_PEP_ID=MMETSP1334-20130426/52716_1 /TAXON_ID=127549 /ORGANISM="Calcidiscus leptoporus, Strain RCC1130" /LENGTH=173 /DNA_ID=CAMNT_0007398949 /DNA_START=25 /DNA_END=546 /DNA_ORIENTATION=+
MRQAEPLLLALARSVTDVLVRTSDITLRTSWRRFLDRLSFLLEARIALAAERALLPLLSAAARILQQSWQPWVLIALAGALVRGGRMRRAATDEHCIVPSLHRLTDPTHTAHHGLLSAHGSGGTWVFVPSVGSGAATVSASASCDASSPFAPSQPVRRLTYKGDASTQPRPRL